MVTPGVGGGGTEAENPQQSESGGRRTAMEGTVAEQDTEGDREGRAREILSPMDGAEADGNQQTGRRRECDGRRG